jgi:phospholipase/lecithinase/hemolysin
MNRSSLKGRLLALLGAFLLFIPAWAGADDRGFHPVDRIVVFGTSLSDPGNAHYLSGNLTAPPNWPGMDPLTLVPASEYPYAAGGGRFSNGLTWVEQLAVPLGLAWSTKAAYDPRNHRASNFAVGGATAQGGTGEVTLSDQLGRFLTAGLRVSEDTLYVIEIGGNDVRAGFAMALAAGGTPAGVQAAVENVFVPAVQSVAETIGLLYEKAGARRFLVWNVPDLGRAPAIARVGAFFEATYGVPAQDVRRLATTVASIYNDGLAGPTPQTSFPGLAGVLNSLSALRDIHILTFNAFATVQELTPPPPGPLKYGLQNVWEPCISLTAPFQCSNPNRFLFWDGIHPTKVGHAIIAVEVGKALIGDALAAH